MFRALTTGMLVGTLLAPMAVRAEQDAINSDVGAFLRSVAEGPQLTTLQYSSELETIRSRNGKRAVVPTLNILAGRLDAEFCVYQLRIDLSWMRGTDAGESESGGRSLIQKAPCATLSDEVRAVVRYEVAALNRRLQDSGRFAMNKEREQVIAAVRRRGADAGDGEYFPAVTIGSRVNLRASPSLKAPVLAKLAPASALELVRTDDADWFLVRGQSGYVHASALASAHPQATTQ